MQEVFLAALEKIDTLRDGAAFGGWLAMIARNRAADFHRSRRKLVEIPEDLGRPDAERAEAERVLRAIQTLPEAYRETLVLRLVEGLSGPEIAEQVGLTPESVRVNLHRGMKMLRDKLGLETGDG
ncbi:MAG: sigma-70 family RNA polymerase sigma factor [Minicystis sp.]